MVRAKSPWWRNWRRFLRQQAGGVLVLWAFAVVPVVIGVGTVVDLSRAYMARSRLTFALDAAGLAAGAAGDTEAEIRAIAEQFFFANFPAGAVGTPTTPVVTIDGGVINISGSVTVETTIMKLVGQGALTVTASAEILRKGLELALILDNTGSMKGSKLNALRNASQDLIDILFQVPELQSNLKVAVVPYSAAVNVGDIAPGLVPSVDPAEYDPSDDDKWKGCVLARAAPNDSLDTPGGAGNDWQRYLWESASDNDYPPTDTDPALCNASTGPNLGCPTPIVPLTGDKTLLDAAVSGMEAWCRGGTFSNVGMVWGWRVLSPGAPFTQALPYETPGFDKVAILMTDGVNGYFQSDYAAYERVADGNLGTTSKSAAKIILNNRLSEVCENMKDAGIIIYTITFQLGSSSTKLIYENCASDPDKYFDSPNGSALQASFQKIAEQLINLRVTQ